MAILFQNDYVMILQHFADWIGRRMWREGLRHLAFWLPHNNLEPPIIRSIQFHVNGTGVQAVSKSLDQEDTVAELLRAVDHIYRLLLMPGRR